MYRITGNFQGRKLLQFYGYLRMLSQQNLGTYRPLARQKQAICKSFLCENRIFHQFTKVFCYMVYKVYRLGQLLVMYIQFNIHLLTVSPCNTALYSISCQRSPADSFTCNTTLLNQFNIHLLTVSPSYSSTEGLKQADVADMNSVCYSNHTSAEGVPPFLKLKLKMVQVVWYPWILATGHTGRAQEGKVAHNHQCYQLCVNSSTWLPLESACSLLYCPRQPSISTCSLYKKCV